MSSATPSVLARMRSCALPLVVSLTGLLAACGSSPAPVAGPRTARAPAAESVVTPPACDVGAFEAKGDIDGELDALGRCSALSLDERMHRAELLALLGEIPAAKAEASEVVTLAHARGATADEIAARAEKLLSTPDPEARTLADVERDVDALVARARSEREPARWIDLAKAKHALARATGETPAPVLVTGTGLARWAAGHALFQVGIHGLPLTAVVENATLVVERDERDGLRATRLITPSVRLNEAQSVAAIPSRPGAFVAMTEGGLRAFYTERDLPPLEVDGALQFVPEGDLLLASTYEHLAAVDVGSWTKRFSIVTSGTSIGSVTKDTLVLVSAGGDVASEVIDLRTGEPRVQLRGSGALSPKARVLAGLADDSKDPDHTAYALHLRATDGSSAERVVAFPGPAINPSLAFDGEDRIMVRDYVPSGMQSCEIVTRAYVDVRTGQSLPIPKDKKSESCSDSSYGVGYDTPSGLSAFAASYGDPELVVYQKIVLAQRVPLVVKDGFSVTGITGTADDRYLVVCGAGAISGAFVVDVKTGAAKFTPIVDSCTPGVVDGYRVIGSRGVIDLARDPDGPSWLEPIEAPFMAEDRVESLSKIRVPTDTPGLFCRFGDLLRPFEVCGPPAPEAPASN